MIIINSVLIVLIHYILYSTKSVSLSISPRHRCPTPGVTTNWGPYLQQVTEPFVHLEEPTWDDRTQLLYFVDLLQGLINSFNPVTREINSVHLDGFVSPVIPTRTKNKFAVGNNKSLVLLNWNGKSGSPAQNVTVLTTVDKDKKENLFADGKADKLGRLWMGTMGFELPYTFFNNQSSFYKFTKNNYKHPEVEITPVSLSNGLAWTKDNKILYYIDSPTLKVNSYDFDLEKGEISNKQVVFDFKKYNIGGFPDGMTIDEDENLFIATYDAGCVIKVDPRKGTLLQKIAIPSKVVTSVAFGGRDLDILFVTTSRYLLTKQENVSLPAAGSLFAITGLKTKGRKAYYADF